MNKSVFEKVQKINEEYEEFLKGSPLQSEMEKIAKDIRDRQNNAVAMEFTRVIAELLRENGIVIHCTEHSCTRDLPDKSIRNVYGVVFDSVDCAEHDKNFKDEIAQLQRNYIKLCAENEALKEQITELNIELDGVKSNRADIIKSYRKGIAPYTDLAQMHEIISEKNKRIAELTIENQKLSAEVGRVAEFLESEIRICEERLQNQNEGFSQLYANVFAEVGVAKKITENHIQFCKKLLEMMNHGE